MIALKLSESGLARFLPPHDPRLTFAQALRLVVAYVTFGTVGGSALVGSTIALSSINLVGPALIVVFLLPPVGLYLRFIHSPEVSIACGICFVGVTAYMFRHPVDTILHPSDLFGVTIGYLGLLLYACFMLMKPVDLMLIWLKGRLGGGDRQGA